jgi:RNA polymerase sigma factor (sigma-70 family)
MGGTDRRLARRAARGDPHAFDEIYRHYGPDLYRFCLAMTGNRQDAQDALQNTMVKVMRALPGEERQIALKPWLYRIARNETVEVLRGRRANEELQVEQAAARTVAETVEVREHLRTLLADLEQLPQRQRAVLLMRELAGLGFAEIGATFETSPAGARQTLYEARLSLRQLEEGRERLCPDVRRELSDADGRVIRRRKTRAHLRDCPGCRTFQAEIVKRQEDLAAIATLPLAAGTAAVKAIATPAIVKSAATVVVAVVAVTAADRGNLVDLPLGSGVGEAPVQRARAVAVTPPRPSGRSVEGADSGGIDASLQGRSRSGFDGQLESEGPAPAREAQPVVLAPADEGETTTALAAGDAEGVEPDEALGPPARSSPKRHRATPAAQQGDPPGDSPEPSAEDQQPAADRKPPQAGPPPGQGPPAQSPGKPSNPVGAPPGKPAEPPGKPGGPPGKPEAPPGKPGDTGPPPTAPAAPPAPPGNSGGNGHGPPGPGKKH